EDKMTASHNTVLFEVKLMAMVIDEAMRRGYCHKNPCRQLKERKHPPKIKPEISECDIPLIERELALEPEWMPVAFAIAIRHATRLRATSIHLERDVDWNAKRITFHEKG